MIYNLQYDKNEYTTTEGLSLNPSAKWYTNGQVQNIKELVKGVIKHICWYTNGQIKSVDFIQEPPRGVLGMRNLDGPTSIYWWPNGQPLSVRYYKNGKPHNDNGPSSIQWEKSGEIKCKSYHLNGLTYNPGAEIKRYANGSISISYKQNGKFHRDNGPAYMKFNSNSLCNLGGGCSLTQVKYYKHGKLHRDDGPATYTRRVDSRMDIHYELQFYIKGEYKGYSIMVYNSSKFNTTIIHHADKDLPQTIKVPRSVSECQKIIAEIGERATREKDSIGHDYIFPPHPRLLNIQMRPV